MTVELIAPDEASCLIEQDNYLGQRRLRKTHVTKLAGQMKARRFGFSIIRIAVRGEREQIIDGQHRLSAVVESGTPVWFGVVREVIESDDEVATVYSQIDDGSRRTKVDVMRTIALADRMGIPESVMIAANGAIPIMMTDFNTRTNAGLMAIAPRKYGIVTKRDWAELPLQFKDEIYAYWRCVSAADNLMYKQLMQSPVMAVGILLFRYRPEEAQAFLDTVARADGLKKGTPEHHLQNLLFQGAIQKRDIAWTKEVAWLTRAVAGCWNNSWKGIQYTAQIQPRTSDNIKILGTPYDDPSHMSGTERRQIDAMFTLKRDSGVIFDADDRAEFSSPKNGQVLFSRLIAETV